jgi:flavoprotein, HI0933 family
MHFDVIVIGGGAAGLMCAATAGQQGKRVALLDHANKMGKKILMSGGGRCNFTNMYLEPSNYLCSNPHFCKSALSRYTEWDFIELVNRYQIPYHEKTLGQLFCDNKANDILQMLFAECDKGKVKRITDCTISSVARRDESDRNQVDAGNKNGTDAEENRFNLETSCGKFSCASLVIASGGLSIPTMGASGFGYQIAEQFGLKLLPRRASLVPFTLSGKWLEKLQPLAGVAIDCTLSCDSAGRKIAFNEAMLFTHRGLSGPAVLQISNYWQLGQPVEFDFLPSDNIKALINEWREQGNKQELKNLLAQKLPKRFVSIWLSEEIMTKPVQQLSVADITKLEQDFHHWKIIPSGTEGYRTAEVTLGGIHTDEVSSKTFEAKKVPGLYFVGEVLDVTGWLGGFNFQWAWASGYCAGLSV